MTEIIFYNHFGNGDIFESREFVKEYLLDFPGCNFYYAHGKDPKIISDISFIKSIAVNNNMPTHKPITKINGTIYINTWIGQNSKYVLPGIGCVVEKHYELHNDIRKILGISPCRKKVIEYIPSIDYSFYNIENIKNFVSNTKTRILICNGNAQSGQAENYNLDPIIEILCKKYLDYDFIHTSPTSVKQPNLFFTGDIIKARGCDLNEISYLSQFCKVIVGRNSGPHVFSQVIENWLDDKKSIVSLTYKQEASTFVLNQPVKMKKFWTNSTDIATVVNLISGVIER